MYSKESYAFDYFTVPGITQLSETHRNLVLRAREASRLAYAPYSQFRVGAAVLLDNGEVVTGSNKENASTPAGICAERNVLNYVSDHYPGHRVAAIAIEASPLAFRLEEPISPCGICRQVMAETEKNQGHPIEVVLSVEDGPVYIFSASADLLPFGFYVPELKK